MTTPDRSPLQDILSPAQAGGGTPTDLIARLANQMFSGFCDAVPTSNACAPHGGYAPVHPTHEPLSAPGPTAPGMAYLPHALSDLLRPESLRSGTVDKAP